MIEYLTLALALILSVIFWFIYRNQSKGLLRYGLFLLLIALLLVWIYNPAYSWYQVEKKVAIITDTLDVDTSVLKRYDFVLSDVNTGKPISRNFIPLSRYILDSLSAEGYSFSLFGYGPNHFSLEGYNWHYYQPPTLPFGFLSFELPDKVVQNSVFKLILTSHTSQHSTLIIQNDDSEFRKRFEVGSGIETVSMDLMLKYRGPNTIVIQLEDENGLIDEQNIQIWVYPSESPVILSLHDSPNYRMRYLSEWIEGSGFEFYQRIRVGKEGYRYSVLNSEEHFPAKPLDFIQKADLVMIDLATIQRLNESDIKKIKERLNLGMHLFITDIPDKENLSKFNSALTIFNKGIELQGEERESERNWFPDLLKSDTTLSYLNTTSVAINGENNGIVLPLLRDESEPHGYSVKIGFGSLFFTLFYDSWKFRLQGKQRDYHALWAAIFEENIKLKRPFINIENQLSFSDRSHTLQIIGAQSDSVCVTNLMNGRSDIAYPFLMPNVTKFTFQAENAGWYRLSFTDVTSPKFIYLYDKNSDWVNAEIYRRFLTNRLSEKKIGTIKTNFKFKGGNTLPDSYYASMAFLLLTLMWIERKINGS